MSSNEEIPLDPTTLLLEKVPRRIRKHPVFLALFLLGFIGLSILNWLPETYKVACTTWVFESAKVIITPTFGLWSLGLWACISTGLLLIKRKRATVDVPTMDVVYEIQNENQKTDARCRDLEELLIKRQGAYSSLENERNHLSQRLAAAISTLDHSTKELALRNDEVLKLRQSAAKLVLVQQEKLNLQNLSDKLKEKCEFLTKHVAGITYAREKEKDDFNAQILQLRHELDRLNASDLDDLDLKALKLVSQGKLVIGQAAAKKLKMSEERLIFHLERLFGNGLIYCSRSLETNGEVSLTSLGRACAVRHKLI